MYEWPIWSKHRHKETIFFLNEKPPDVEIQPIQTLFSILNNPRLCTLSSPDQSSGLLTTLVDLVCTHAICQCPPQNLVLRPESLTDSQVVGLAETPSFPHSSGDTLSPAKTGWSYFQLPYNRLPDTHRPASNRHTEIF